MKCLLKRLGHIQCAKVERDDIRRQTSKRQGFGCSRFILPLLSQSDKKGFA